MRNPAIVIGMLCSSAFVHAQYLVSDSLMTSFTLAELVDLGIGNAENPVEVYRLIYNTVDAHGAPTIASGAVVLPVQNTCYHAIAEYMHGTILDRNDVPSRLTGEIVVGYFLGGTGYVAVLPDYLGLGDGPGRHPYVHAASEATASIDMIRAVREFCVQQNTLLNGQVFLIGYSQGGHACMATHKMIQEQFPDEFNITASAPCSGPYDVSGVQAEAMTGTDPYPAPYYLPYVLFSYADVYPNLHNDVSEVIKEPWATTLPPLFQGNNGSGAVDAVMPAVPSEILQDSVLASFSTDPNHRMRVALRDNNLYDWAPIAPMRIVYCMGDNHVFYENSIVTLNAMHANGALHVEGVDMGNLDHNSCAFPALLQGKNLFDSLKGDCTWNGIEERTSTNWSLYPNPAKGMVHIVSSDGAGGQVQWTLLQADGREAANGRDRFHNGELVLPLPGAAPGAYILRMTTAGEQRSMRVVLE